MPRNMPVRATPLPATNETLVLATRPMKLCDHIKDALMNGAYEVVVPYLQTVNAREGVTGSRKTDEVMAAYVLQNWAADNGKLAIKTADLAQISTHMIYALRAIRDEHGQRIDRTSRRRAALAAPIAESETADS